MESTARKWNKWLFVICLLFFWPEVEPWLSPLLYEISSAMHAYASTWIPEQLRW